jgi:hypothetical protein
MCYFLSSEVLCNILYCHRLLLMRCFQALRGFSRSKKRKRKNRCPQTDDSYAFAAELVHHGNAYLGETGQDLGLVSELNDEHSNNVG